MSFSREWVSLVERDPVAAMRRFVSDWHAPLAREEGVSEAELTSVQIPDPLAALFRLAGRSQRVLAVQNAIVDFDRWKKDAFALSSRQRLYTEAQGVWTVDVETMDSEAQVFFKDWNEDPSLPPMERLPGFLLQAVVFEAICGAAHLLMGECHASSLPAVVAPLSKLPLAPWHWPAFPGEFWAGEGVCVFLSPLDDEHSYVSAGAIAPGRLEWLERLGVHWDSIRKD